MDGQPQWVGGRWQRGSCSNGQAGRQAGESGATASSQARWECCGGSSSSAGLQVVARGQDGCCAHAPPAGARRARGAPESPRQGAANSTCCWLPSSPSTHVYCCLGRSVLVTTYTKPSQASCIDKMGALLAGQPPFAIVCRPSRSNDTL